jgi:hypothetical protein
MAPVSAACLRDFNSLLAVPLKGSRWRPLSLMVEELDVDRWGGSLITRTLFWLTKAFGDCGG